MRLIDADALREQHCADCSEDVRTGCISDPVCATMEWVNLQPTVDPVKHGHWVVLNDDYGEAERIECSCCGDEYCCEYSLAELAEESHYCPNCGAKMDEVSE